MTCIAARYSSLTPGMSETSPRANQEAGACCTRKNESTWPPFPVLPQPLVPGGASSPRTWALSPAWNWLTSEVHLKLKFLLKWILIL